MLKEQGLIVENLDGLLNAGLLTDVHFVVRGVKLAAHSQIVAASSPVLAELFSWGIDQNAPKIVMVDNTRPDAFRHFLKYLYTGVLPELDRGMTVLLFVLAHQFQVDSLKTHCANCLGELVEMENIVATLYLSQIYSSQLLRQKTLRFIWQHCTFEFFTRINYIALIKRFPALEDEVMGFLFTASNLN